MSRDRLYQIWYNLQRKKANVKWSNFDEFATWAHHAGYKPGQYLNRVNTDLPFSAENCVWGDTRDYVRDVAGLRERVIHMNPAGIAADAPLDWDELIEKIKIMNPKGISADA